MLHSQQQMQRSASEIAGLAMTPAPSASPQTAGQSLDSQSLSSQSSSSQSSSSQSLNREPLLEPMLRMQQQQQVFDASAQVVSTADELIGNLLNIKA